VRGWRDWGCREILAKIRFRPTGVGSWRYPSPLVTQDADAIVVERFAGGLYEKSGKHFRAARYKRRLMGRATYGCGGVEWWNR